MPYSKNRSVILHLGKDIWSHVRASCNTAEREMKRIAIGRKNWLFFGSSEGGRTGAILFTFTSTCYRLGVEPWVYFKDVLSRLPAPPKENLHDLLPDRWQTAQAQAQPSPAV